MSEPTMRDVVRSWWRRSNETDHLWFVFSVGTLFGALLALLVTVVR